MTVKDVFRILETAAPTRWADHVYPGDNVGFLVGRRDAPVMRVLVALDITPQTIAEARRLSAELIVSHHPVIFGLKSITDESATGRIVLSLLEHGLSAICMHTNWDAAPGGVNETLADLLGLQPPLACLEAPYTDHDGRVYGMGRMGLLPAPMPADEFALQVKEVLNARGVRVWKGSRPVHRVAVCSGSGSSLWSQAIQAGCDTFVAGDLKHHLFVEAMSLDITCIDAGHFATENPAMRPLADFLAREAPELQVFLSDEKQEPAQWV